MLKKDNVDEDWKVLGKNLRMLRKCWEQMMLEKVKKWVYFRGKNFELIFKYFYICHKHGKEAYL